MNWLRYILAIVLGVCGGAFLLLHSVHATAHGWQPDSLLLSAGVGATAALMLISAKDLRWNKPSEPVHEVQRGEQLSESPLVGREAGLFDDAFPPSPDMTAALNASGEYVYVSDEWAKHFGHIPKTFQEFISFESAFPPEAQAEAAALFRRAKHSLGMESGNLHVRNAEGEIGEYEAVLSCRRDEGKPVLIRCILRNVTAQNRRARMLALQLKASELIVESTAADQTLLAVAETLCRELGWDFCALWKLDEMQEKLAFCGAWSAPERPCEIFLRETSRSSFRRGDGLPGKIWSLGNPIWMNPIEEELSQERRKAADLDGLVSGWGLPIRVGNQVIAVMEFFASRDKREDPEMIATVETVCASMGQFLARSMQEDRFRELHRQQEFILNSVADGIIGIDGFGRVDFINPAASRMLGDTQAWLMGRQFHSIIHAPVAESCTPKLCRVLDVLSRREAIHGQETFHRRDKSSMAVELSVTPLLEHGSVTGAVVSFRDVSDRQALDQMKDEFISTVSHELRTPLTSIRGALGLLSAGVLGDVNERAANLLRIAVSNSDRLVRLINDILDLERLESGRAPLAFRPVSLRELVQQAVDNMSPVADAAQVALLVEADPIEVEADPDRMLQVITNLVSNAVKFSTPGSVVKIIVNATPEGTALKVIDEGRGIPADKLESIFDRFQQVDASDSRQKGGTGLGLAICRTILHQHHGRIWAERNMDRGSVFTVLLPGKGPVKIPPTARGEREIVLVCAPAQVSRKSISSGLERRGYRTIEVDSTQQALALSSTAKVSAILIDISLPGLDDWRAIDTLRGESATANVPVVLLSLLNLERHARMHDGWIATPDETHAKLDGLAALLRSRLKRATVLLVENDRDIATMIAAPLILAGAEVSHADSCSRSIQLCVSSKPDLILLDLGLPEDEGLHLMKWLRKSEDYRRLPVVVYSTKKMSDAERERVKVQPADFFASANLKPDEIEALIIAMLPQNDQSATAKTNQSISNHYLKREHAQTNSHH